MDRAVFDFGERSCVRGKGQVETNSLPLIADLFA